MRVAVLVARSRGAASVVVAAPVAAPDTVDMLKHEADLVVVPLVPAHFRAVGEHYQNFKQTTDEEVHAPAHVMRGRRVAASGRTARVWRASMGGAVRPDAATRPTSNQHDAIGLTPP